MPVGITTAAITRLVGKILDDIYDLGKEMFSSQLEKLKRDGVRRALTKRASACEKVKTIWQLDKEVSIPDFYYPSRIKFNPEVTKEVSSLSHLPSKGNFVIEGTIGQGKSIFLRYLCAQELRGKGTGRIPVFVELRLVDTKTGLQGAVIQTLDEYGFDVTEDLWDFYSKSGKFVLLLDAFDELPAECIPGVIAELERLSSKYPNLQIVVTSRPESEIHHSRHFRIFRLAALQRTDYKPFLKKLLLNDGDVRDLLQAIQASPARVASLLTTPLMLTLVAVVYRAEQAIPPELPQFFEMLFTTLLSRHDRTKSGFIRKRYSQLTERETQTLFEAFCFMTRYHQMSTSLTDSDISRALSDAHKYSGIECDQDDFYKDITKIACLMQREGVKSNFIHKSIQEFFSASFIRRANDAFAKRYYESQRRTFRTWRQENSFLAHIDTYRYAKYFYMPELEAIERYYNVNFGLSTPVADERILQLAIEGHVINVSVTEEGLLESELSANYPPDAGPLLRQILLLPNWECYRHIDSAHVDEKEQILGITEEIDENSYQVPLSKFFRERNLMPELAEDINEQFRSMKLSYDHFSNIIALEESKAGLFLGVTGSVTAK